MSQQYIFEPTNGRKQFARGSRIRTDHGREGTVIEVKKDVVTVEYDADKRGIEPPVSLELDLARRLWCLQ